MRKISVCILSIVTLVACNRVKNATQMKADDATIQSAASYAQACQAQGVPLPSALSDKAFWNYPLRKDTKGHQHFGGSSGAGDLYLSETNGQGCALIVRNDHRSETREGDPNSDRTLSLCWSSSGNVCFWSDPQAPLNLDASNSTYKIFEVSNAAVTSSVSRQPCTECHRGGNALIGHGELGFGNPDPSYLDLPMQGTPFKQALVPQSWPQNGMGTKDTQCAGDCHVIPQLTPPYCFLAQRMVSDGLMLGTAYGLGAASKITPQPSADLKASCTPYIKLLNECDEFGFKQMRAASPNAKLYPFYATKQNLGACAIFKDEVSGNPTPK